MTRTFRGAVVAFAVVLIALTARAQTASFHNTVPVPAPAPAPAKRLALVVGNSHYKYIPALDNPQNDARLIATTLASLGFTLVGGGAQIDLDRQAFEAAIRSFGRQIGGADVALFYYAGHGLQVHGTNWLVPVSANPTTVTDLDYEMIDAELVLKQMEAARTRLNLVILDACRNNPFGGQGMRDAAGGLAQMQAPEGTLVSYATQPGNVARDGDAGDSPYSKALAETMRRPGLDVFQLFNTVGLEVKRVTGGEQQPWVSNSPIDGDFYFSGLPKGAAGAAGAAPAAAPSVAAGEIELAYWNSIKNSSDVADFAAYLKKYPQGNFADLARNRISVLQPAPSPVSPPRERVVVATPPPRPPSTPAPAPGTAFRDCPGCPEMVALPPGRFMMGTAAAAARRERLLDRVGAMEQPQHAVTVQGNLAIGKFDVTREEFAHFVTATGYAGANGCYLWTVGDYAFDARKSWRDPGFAQTERDPVVCVNMQDVDAFIAWMVQTTGKSYRLPTEAEWEYAARAGTKTLRWWGNPIGSGNADCGGCGSRWDAKSTAPAGSFAANPFGLYDVLGNAWQWTADCWNDSYDHAPNDASVRVVSGQCGGRVLRGGSWVEVPRLVRAARRLRHPIPRRQNNVGFRVLRVQ